MREVEAKTRTVEEMIADLPEWARKIVKIARRKAYLENSDHPSELKAAVIEAKIEQWRK